MRSLQILVLPVLVALLLSASGRGTTAQAVTKKDASALVAEYVKEDTSESRRTEILTRLKTADKGLVATPLKTAAADAAQVGPAVTLGLALRLPGLFASARKHIDGDYEDVIIQYSMTLSEPGAADMAWERWKAKDIDGTSWSLAHGALTGYSIPLAVVQKVKTFLDAAKEDDPRHEHAAVILRFQLGLGDATPAKIRSEWKQIIADYELDARTFGLSGTDLLAGDVTELGTVLKVGGNRRLQSGASLAIAATEAWQKNSFSIVLRLRIVQDCKVEVALSSDQGQWEPVFENGEWVLETGNREQLVQPGKLLEWTELRFDLSPTEKPRPGGAEVRNARHCKITIGGKQLIEYGTFNGGVKSLQVTIGAGVVVIGGVELIAK